jgi:hypothetical protein
VTFRIRRVDVPPSPPDVGWAQDLQVSMLLVTHQSYAQAAVPVVMGISPTSGPTAGGTSVTINGNGFTGATSVTFVSASTGSSSAAFIVVSDTEITATSPPGSGTVDVTVTTPAGTSAISGADQFTYTENLPMVASVVPSEGPSDGGTSVAITGSGFTGATNVAFGPASAGFTVVSDVQITADTPGGMGAVPVTVTTPAGTSARSILFMYRKPPKERDTPALSSQAQPGVSAAPENSPDADQPGGSQQAFIRPTDRRDVGL